MQYRQNTVSGFSTMKQQGLVAILTLNLEGCLRALILLVSAMVAGCAQSPVKVIPLSVDTTSALASEKITTDYIAAYNYIARGIRKCWLADKKPLQKSQFFARTNVKGEEKKAAIFIHAPAPSPKRGPRIFSVHLIPISTGTELRFDNRSLDPLNEQRLSKDIRQWAIGKTDCLDHSTSNEITPASLDKRDAEIKAKIPLPKRK